MKENRSKAEPSGREQRRDAERNAFAMPLWIMAQTHTHTHTRIHKRSTRSTCSRSTQEQLVCVSCGANQEAHGSILYVCILFVCSAPINKGWNIKERRTKQCPARLHCCASKSNSYNTCRLSVLLDSPKNRTDSSRVSERMSWRPPQGIHESVPKGSFHSVYYWIKAIWNNKHEHAEQSGAQQSSAAKHRLTSMPTRSSQWFLQRFHRFPMACFKDFQISKCLFLTLQKEGEGHDMTWQNRTTKENKGIDRQGNERKGEHHMMPTMCCVAVLIQFWLNSTTVIKASNNNKGNVWNMQDNERKGMEGKWTDRKGKDSKGYDEHMFTNVGLSVFYVCLSK